MSRKLCRNASHMPWTLHHNTLMASPKTGWLYAATMPGGVLKVGGTSQCPICRMDHYDFKPELVGVRPCEDWRADEARMLDLLGKPIKGKEWFSESEDRLRFLFSERIILPIGEALRALDLMMEAAEPVQEDCA